MSSQPAREGLWLRSCVLIGLLLGGSVVVAGALYSIREEPPRREITTPVPLVEWVELAPQDVPVVSHGYGTAEPDRSTHIAAEVPAVVRSRVDDLEVGTHVEAGQALIQLDDREYRHALDRALAAIDADRAALDELTVDEDNLDQLVQIATNELRVVTDELARVEGLYKEGRAARKELDFAKLAYEQAQRNLQDYRRQASRVDPQRARLQASLASREAEAEIARLNVQRCVIRAPYAGVIDALRVESGDHVGPGTVVAGLLDSSLVEIPIRLPAGAYDDVMVGASCTVRSERMGGNTWTGRVARIAGSVDGQSRTFAAYVEVDNTKQAQPLVPGMFVTAEIVGPTLHGVLALPRAALRDGQVVVVEKGNLLKRHSVTILRILGEQASVAGDFAVGDRVVLSHLDQLSDGMKVRLREESSSGAAGSSAAGMSP